MALGSAMITMIAQLVTLLVFVSTCGMSSPLLELHNAKRQTIGISTALQRDTIPDYRAIDSLERTIDRICSSDSSHLPFQLTSRESWKDDLARLFFWYQTFRVAYDAQCSPDSLRTEFHRFSTSFHLAFCDYFLAEARQQQSVRLLLFAPSISCECTMRMSMGYEHLLDSVTTEIGNGVDLIMIDTVFKEDFCSAFGILDVPTIVLLDRGNREVRRWVREEAIGHQVRAAVRTLF